MNRIFEVSAFKSRLNVPAALAVGFCSLLIASDNSIASGSQAFDYMVQKVCIGQSGNTLHISPLDPECTQYRNLKVGELLPYHKHDWPELTAADTSLKGQQRGDSVPITVSGLGLAALHTFDFGDGARHFGVYDGAKGDGLSIVSVNGSYFGSVMTLDHTGGAQLFVNTDLCRDFVNLESVKAGWMFGPVDLSKTPNGTLHNHIHRVQKLGIACPDKFTYATTNWYFTEFRPMNGPNSVGSKTLHTLISEHFAGPDDDHLRNLERMYFSRELGRMRWERWQNFNLQQRNEDDQKANLLTAQGRCAGGVGAPMFTGQWVRIACREWTNIVPSVNEPGDNIYDWLSPLIIAYQATPISLINIP